MTTVSKYYIKTFGKYYPITAEQANKSVYLRNAFGFTGFHKQNVVDLNLGEKLKIPFKYIYKFLIDSDKYVSLIDAEYIYGILVLESFLGVPEYRKHVINSLEISARPVKYYSDMYNEKFIFTKEVSEILENKIIEYATTIKDIPTKTINKMGTNVLLGKLIQTKNKLKEDLRLTRTSMRMMRPYYWEDFNTIKCSDKIYSLNEEMVSTMNSLIDINKFIKELKTSGMFFEAKALAKTLRDSFTTVLQGEKLGKFIKFLYDAKLYDSLKNIDIEILELYEEYIPDEVYGKWNDLNKNM